jgi:hypothetical protein
MDSIHSIRLRKLISSLTHKIILEKLINNRLCGEEAPNSIYINSLYEDIESLQTAIVLLELNDPHFKKEDNENI